MAWLYLIAAGITEIVWAVGLKYSDGFKRLGPSIFTVIVMLLSFVLLSQAMRKLPLGTSYACGPASAPWARCCSACGASTSRATFRESSA